MSLMEINSTTPPELIIDKAKELALSSDIVGLTNLIRRAAKAEVDPRILEMLNDFVETAMI